MRTLPILLLLAAATLGGCATTGDRAVLDPRDPMEGFNRSVWNFNQGLDKAAIKPATQVYRAVTPPPARRGLSRILANLYEPFNAINSLLQGRADRAFNSLGRFVVNTTIGVGGLADHATELGLPPTDEDFGQTLAVWGVNSSYLVLPVLGPSTIRDGIGSGVSFAVNPVGIALDQAGASTALEYTATGVQVLQARSEVIDSGVDAFLETSADPYATAREAYFQRREAEIANRDNELSTQDEDKLLNDALQEGQPDASAEPQSGAEPPAPEPAPDATAPTAETPTSPQLSMLEVSDESIAY
jgi:phospholipid-binding lipoprotein MlaA